jgi:hypothetical protein
MEATMRKLSIVPIALLAALAMAGPAAANETVRWTDSQDIANTYSCGVVEDSVATIQGTAYFAADGSWIKDILRFTYDASFTDPASGHTVAFKTRQVVEATPETVTFRAQGLFVRAPGQGAVLLDVGRLVIDPADGSTVFASANALGFDDPSVPARMDAAICSLF